MSMREADRLKVVQAVVNRTLCVGPAGKRIGVMPRQLERLFIRYKEEGPAGLTRVSEAAEQPPAAVRCGRART